MNGKTPVGSILLYAVGGAMAGTLVTIGISRLLPAPSAGDGFSVRWVDRAGSEHRVDFGENEKAALQKAIDLATSVSAATEVLEIRQGRIVRIQAAGQPPKEVP